MIDEIKKDKFLTFLITFSLILFKYIEVWSYLFTKEFFKSKIVIIFAIIMVFTFVSNLKFDKKNFRKIIFVGILCLIISYLSKSIDYIISFTLAVIYSKYSSGEDIYIKNFLKSSMFLFLITLVMSFLNILPSFSITRIVDNQVIIRNNLGFIGANSLFMFFYPLVISIYLINYDKIKSKKIFYIISLLLLSYVFYKYTNCRTGMLCVLIISIVYLFDNILNKKIIKLFLKYHYIILFLISIFFSLYFSEYNNAFNILSSGRFYTWNYYVSKTNYTLLGIKPVLGIPLDNIYLNTYYFYGLISFFMCIIISLLPFRTKNLKDKFYFITFAFSIYGFFEANIAYVFNFLIFFQIYYIINNDISSKKKNMIECEGNNE